MAETRPYNSLRELIEVLDQKGKLIRVSRAIVKETELMPLVRLQFRGLPEDERKGFLFDNVVGVTGRKYDSLVAVGVLAASREIYAIGLGCKADAIDAKWTQALLNPIKPVLVASGPCQEEVHMGKELEEDGLDELAIPVNTPGFGGCIRTTASHVFTKDIETGVQNCGCYAGKLLNRNTIGLNIAPTHHGSIHWKKFKERGLPLHAAIVVGAPPPVAYASVVALPYGTDECAVAGGLAGEPVAMVKCKTIDLEVPAQSEIVIEGEVATDRMVGEAAYGEFVGYMAIGGEMGDYFMKVTCITHRKRPIYNSLLSQMTPSESSKISQVGLENVYFKHLRYDCNIPGILEVSFPESTGGRMWCVVRMKKRNPSEAWQALSAANALSPERAKIIIVVDEDIDPRDADSVNWAVATRMQPHRDLHVMRGRGGGLDYSAYRPEAHLEQKQYPDGMGASSLLMDATIKWPYPPTALPRKEYMERAVEIWQELKLPPLKLKTPWYGYKLGYWLKDDEENAEMIVKGDYKSVGKKLLQMGVEPKT
jgi:UbiD family decarboxylase